MFKKIGNREDVVVICHYLSLPFYANKELGLTAGILQVSMSQDN